nr:DNA-directed RNA polymerase 19 kDa subunit [Wadden Sea poxvirus]
MDESDEIDCIYEDDSSVYENSDSDNTENDTTNSLENSDIISSKTDKIESVFTQVDDLNYSQLKDVASYISSIKKRYTRRVSLFEITGILAESYNLLQRGRLPLLSNFTELTFNDNILHIVIKEIKEGTCPIIIEKNGELLSINDFDDTGLDYHLNYIINIWKQQHRY